MEKVRIGAIGGLGVRVFTGDRALEGPFIVIGMHKQVDMLACGHDRPFLQVTRWRAACVLVQRHAPVGQGASAQLEG